MIRAALLSVLFVALFALTGCPPQEKLGRCGVDSECASGHRCVNGECVKK